MIVPLLFFVSGVSALVLETVFLRQMTWLLGSAVTATSLVLAAYLGGLAAGAVAWGPVADRSARPLRLYGLLEAGVAASGAAFVAIFGPWRAAVLDALRREDGSLAATSAAVLATAALLVPTFLMGGTLPVLSRALARDPRGLLRPLGLLYGVNTLGGAVGAFTGGIVLFERVGIASTGWLAAGAAALAGLGAIAVDRAGAPVAPAEPESARTPSPPTRATTACLVVAAAGGAAVLGYEVLWTRLLTLPMRSYAYSFSLMLSMFLLGIVLGSLAVSRLAGRIRDPLRWAGAAQLAAGAWVATSVVWMPALLTPSREGAGGFASFLLNAAIRAAPVVLPPTILSGMALPLVARAFSLTGGGVGRDVGRVFAANTFGAIAGALAAGLFLLPAAGASRALALLAVVHAASGAVAIAAARATPRLRAAAVAVVLACGAALALPREPFVRAFLASSGGGEKAGEILRFHEGATDTVAVVRKRYGFHDPDAKSVITNGIAMTATVKPVWRYMAAEGHLPALLAPDPSRGAVICVGTGITLGALASHAGVRSIDAVDLSEGVLGALPLFDSENGAVRSDPRVRFVRQDGRNFLEAGSGAYGLITVEPPPPVVAGSAHLYAAEFYETCRRRLEPGGVVAQWLPLHAQSPLSARMAARTFVDAFPYVQLWLPSIRDAVLVGSDRPLELPLSRLRAAWDDPETRANLARAYFETPEALLATYLFDREGILRWIDGAPAITDDRPAMEFFRSLGPFFTDREIGSLLVPRQGSWGFVRGLESEAGLAARIASENEALRLYLASEVREDAAAGRRAAETSAGTRFFLYRLGCDPAQLERLASDSNRGPQWSAQATRCATLAAPAARPEFPGP